MIQKLVHYFTAGSLLLILSAVAHATEMVDAVELVYNEVEQNTEPYTVKYKVTRDHVRIDDEYDSSGYIVFDIRDIKIYSVSHYDKSILVIPEYPHEAYSPEFEVQVEYRVLDKAPTIQDKKVYNYRVKAVTTVTTETCMDIQLVPGLLPDIAKTLQSFQKIVSSQQVISLEATPEEFRTPCYMIDQIYNKGDYYSKGLPVQEWHSNERRRQLINFERTKVDPSIFEIPPDYRQYSLKEQ
jgi:hypothetical protein